MDLSGGGVRFPDRIFQWGGGIFFNGVVEFFIQRLRSGIFVSVGWWDIFFSQMERWSFFFLVEVRVRLFF